MVSNVASISVVAEALIQGNGDAANLPASLQSPKERNGNPSK